MSGKLETSGSPAVLKNMVELPGGTFRMGSERFYPEERPVREVSVDGFWIDRHPVTVAEFRRFVKATGHVTWAERPPEPDATTRTPIRSSRSRLARVPQDRRPGRPARLPQLVGLDTRAPTGAIPKGPGSTSEGASGTR